MAPIARSLAPTLKSATDQVWLEDFIEMLIDAGAREPVAWALTTISTSPAGDVSPSHARSRYEENFNV
jgi:hypothetical protein